MKKQLLLIILPMLLVGSIRAQEPDTLSSTLPMHRHAVTTSPLTFFNDALLITYEHALPIRSSLEFEIGAQGFHWKEHQGSGAVTRPGVATTVGYKLFLPLGRRSRSMARAGSLPRTSFFLKPRLTFVHQWSSYDVYVGNNGWNIITQRTTLHEDVFSMAIIGGYQFVSDHGFVLAPYFGYSIPFWVHGPFHTIEHPGASAAYYELLTLGFNLGWAF